MPLSSSERFDTLAHNYATSEVHVSSPTRDRLHEIVPQPESVCDVASGAGHTGLGFAGVARRIVAVDPAPNMLTEVRRLADERGLTSVETVEAFAESIPLSDEGFDLVVCRVAAHHFNDVALAMSEMTRLAKRGGHVAIIDMEGAEDPEIDALNHDIEVLHDPTHVRSYTVSQWRTFFEANDLDLEVCENRWWEFPAGLTVGRWCELGNSGDAALQEIRARLSAAPPASLQALEITRDADGEFRLPVRTLLLVGRKP